jgi:hypothetical protein
MTGSHRALTSSLRSAYDFRHGSLMPGTGALEEGLRHVREEVVVPRVVVTNVEAEEGSLVV